MDDEPTLIEEHSQFQYNSLGERIEGAYGLYKEWKIYINDKMVDVHHRTNGPARMWEYGLKQYWLNGIWFENIKSDEEWIIKQIIE
jgi:hypothetical protein